MKNYICPMHPEEIGKKGDRCSKCGMKLVPKDEAKNHNLDHHSMDHGSHATDPTKTTWKSYLPLIVIISIILATSLTISYKDYLMGVFALKNLISYFMIGFFLSFSAFKLMDIKGFAEGYFTYDLLAQRWFSYGYIYPFIELFFGLAMILTESRTLLWAELIIMTFSGLGVAIKLAKKEKFQCACLGTFLKVPLTKVTLIEDFGMAFLAAALLVLS